MRFGGPVGYSLGIDLGTTYTAAAIARGDRAEVATLGYRAMSIPTVAFLPADGAWIVGEAAERRAGQDPSRVAREFKRRVGDPAGLLLGGIPVHVERLVAEVLRWVHLQVAESEGEPPTSLVLTHPANWGEFKRDVLREAARLADLPGAHLLTEPVAAAGWYAQAERLEPGSTVAVYDLGGGTFDAVVLRSADDGGFETLGVPDGIERLGGVDIDQAVVSHVLDSLGDAAPDPAAEDSATITAMVQVRRACVEAKEALSSDTSVTIPVWLPGFHDEVLLQRSELEDLIRPMLEPSVKALERAVNSAHLGADDLDAVLLVGGSSRIPLVARLISSELRRPVVVDAHPKHPVALGAALHASASTDAPRAQPAPRTPRQPKPASPLPPRSGPVPPLQHADMRTQNVAEPVENTRKRRRRSFVDLQLPVLVGLVVAVVAWALAYWDDDPRGGPGSPETLETEPPLLAWKGGLETGGAVTLDDERIYSLKSGTVTANNLENRSLAWTKPTGAGDSATMALSEGVLFISYPGAEVLYTEAFDAESGDPRFDEAQADMYVGQPAVVGDTLLYHVADYVIGYNLGTGLDTWRRKVDLYGDPGSNAQGPVVAGDTVVIAGAEGGLARFDPGSRGTRWSEPSAFANPKDRPVDIVVAGDAVVVTVAESDQLWIGVFNLSDGSLRWDDAVAGQYDPALVVGDTVAVPADSKLTLYDIADGEVRAEIDVELDPSFVTVPGEVDALVYSDGDKLRGISPSGDELWPPVDMPFEGSLVSGPHTVAVRSLHEDTSAAVYRFPG